MFTLTNAQLTVTVLDPNADQARFGARYCTGGYIYQITDAQHGDLLSGPTYPHAFNWFDGQGIPDSFRTHLVDPNNTNNPVELGIGIGLINRADHQVTEFCTWEVADDRDTMRFTTTQSFLGWSFELTRELRLVQRSLISRTQLKNTGQDAVPIYWFPHPFFPHYATGETCKCNIPIRMPENAGFELLPNGFIGEKNQPWDRRGHFQELEFDAGQALVVLQKHPKIGLIAATFSFSPAYFPIWGNRNTFSFEPYYQQLVAPGDEVAWTVTYDF
jgi:hypothetical protein